MRLAANVAVHYMRAPCPNYAHFPIGKGGASWGEYTDFDVPAVGVTYRVRGRVGGGRERKEGYGTRGLSAGVSLDYPSIGKERDGNSCGFRVEGRATDEEERYIVVGGGLRRELVEHRGYNCEGVGCRGR